MGNEGHRRVLLAEAVRRLVDLFQPDRIYLFGSQARGDGTEDSDYDIVLVVSDSAPHELRRSRLAYQTLWGLGASVDVIVMTEQRFDSRRHLESSLPATIEREGKLLYVSA